MSKNPEMYEIREGHLTCRRCNVRVAVHRIGEMARHIRMEISLERSAGPILLTG